jgi:uncharacterized protein YjlB
MIRKLQQSVTQIRFDSLRYEFHVLANTLRTNMKRHVSNAERNMFFGHSGSWAQGMTAHHLHHCHANKVIARSPEFARYQYETTF